MGSPRRWTPATAGFPAAPGTSWRRPGKYLDVALSVVKVADDAPLPDLDGTLPAVPADADRLRELGDRWGLGSSLGRFVSAVSPSLGSHVLASMS